MLGMYMQGRVALKLEHFFICDDQFARPFMRPFFFNFTVSLGLLMWYCNSSLLFYIVQLLWNLFFKEH